MKRNFNYFIKHFTFILFISIIMFSCEPSRYDMYINRMTCPVIMHSKSNSGIILQDGSGDLHFISYAVSVSVILGNTFERGDTIKSCI